MGRIVWIAGIVVLALAAGTGLFADRGTRFEPVVVVETQALPTIIEPVRLEPGRAGSALSAAAFGLSALQPETYNGEIVLDIIEASPLAYGEKDRLTAKLMAAEAGNAELPQVLADIRVSLAVD